MKYAFVPVAMSLCALFSCVNVHVDPIYVTVDVNIRVDRQLDSFFAFEQEGQTPATQPVAPQAATSGLNQGKGS